MKIKIAYGKKGLKIEVPRENVLAIVQRKPARKINYPEKAIKSALDNPIKSPALRKLAQGKNSACIIISDKTRPVPSSIILPPVLKVLEDSGIDRKKIVILVACGLHSSSTGKELIKMLGKSITKNYRIVNHKAGKHDELKFLGYTKNKTPVFINKYYLGAQLKIATGLIEPHFMAGYSGGRKAICPGICGLKTIRYQHGPRYLESSYSRSGNLKKNPFHKEATEIARMAGMDFLVNVSLNERREIDGIFAGDMEEAFLCGVGHIEKKVRIKVKHAAEIVITSGGGHPLDATFYQSVKGMLSALNIVQKNGLVIIASKCEEGIGSKEFQQLLRNSKGCRDFLEKIKSPRFFVIDQWEVEEMCKVLGKAEILFYSSCISKHILKELMVRPVNSVEEGIKQGLQKYGRQAKIIVIPEGPYVVAALEA